MKKLISVNLVLITAAICMFVNSLGYQAFANIQYPKSSVTKLDFTSSDEFKSIKSLSFIDSEESIIELENFDNSDDDEDNSNPLFYFSFNPFELREYNNYSQFNLNYHTFLFSTYVPLYIKYNNYRL